MINIDLTKNKKQAIYFGTAIEAALGLNPYRFLSYGGGIRGGKTYVTLAALGTLSNYFKGSRWHVFRSDMPALKATTIPSFEKLIAGSKNWKFNRSSSNYFAYNKFDSKIFFKGENIQNDPSLMDLLGIETNGIFLEQSEELSKTLWEKSLERTGSWYIDPMPRGLIFQTFNPTQNWVKDLIYTPYMLGELPPEYYYVPALPNENPFVTEDQWKTWGMMAGRYQNQFIKGDWTDFDGGNNLWAFGFSRKSIGRVDVNRSEEVFLSFDFNRNPITCLVSQNYNDVFYGIEQIEVDDCTTIRLCNIIEEKYPNCYFRVTGDASGKSLSTLANLDNFRQIQAAFNLRDSQMDYSGSNPPLAQSRMQINSFLEVYPCVFDEVKCKPLIRDFETVKSDKDGKPIKTNRKDLSQRADCLDSFRYTIHRFLKHYLLRL